MSCIYLCSNINFVLGCGQKFAKEVAYNDWRVFHVFHPEQKELKELLGSYQYPCPQGESIAQVCDRHHSFSGMLIREYAEKHVLVITHHITVLAARQNYERFTQEEFIRLDNEEKPINCGVTIYHGDSSRGRNGKLTLQTYNERFY